MASLRLPFALVFALPCLSLFACETGNRCDRVACSNGRTCNPANGACEGGAGGSNGSDAGACTTDCDGGVCNPATNSCVQCVSDSDCSCGTSSPTCSSANVCVANGTPIVTPSEACTSAPTMRACVGSTLHFSVDLTGAKDDLVGSCGLAGAGGRDKVLNLLLSAAADVRIVAQPATNSSAQPVVSVRQECATSGDLACVDGLGAAGGAATVVLKSLPAGNWPIIFDSFDSTSAGLLDVVVTVSAPTPPANDTCLRAEALPAAGGSASSDLALAADDRQLSCNTTADSPEVFYTLSLSASSDVTLTASAKAGTAVTPVVALLGATGLCTADPELSCVPGTSGGSAEVRRHALAAGEYLVAVEADGRATAGPVKLLATIVTPPAPPPYNDTCATPRAITFQPGSNTATFTVDTWAATDNEKGGCNGAPDSPEVVYTLTLGAPRTVTVTTIAAPGSVTDPVIYLRADACNGIGATEYACDDALQGTPDTFTVPLGAGTYWLFVEGYGPDGAGPTQVTVTLVP